MALAEVLRSIRVHGQGRDRYENIRIGLNGRLDTLQAAILLVKMDIFDQEVEARQTVAERYSEGFARIGGSAFCGARLHLSLGAIFGT